VTFRVADGATTALIGPNGNRQDHPAADRRGRPRRARGAGRAQRRRRGDAPVRRPGARRPPPCATCSSSVAPPRSRAARGRSTPPSWR
jgi:hypothetical protein